MARRMLSGSPPLDSRSRAEDLLRRALGVQGVWLTVPLKVPDGLYIQFSKICGRAFKMILMYPSIYIWEKNRVFVRVSDEKILKTFKKTFT